MTIYHSRRYASLNIRDPRHLRTIHRLMDMPEGARVLEVGAGQGHLTKRLAERGLDVIGIDANAMAAEVGETSLVIEGSASALEFDDEVFDFVIAVHSLEHIPDIEIAAGEIVRVLKTGGRALFIYPAEPIQGLYAIPTAVVLHRNPFKARSVHCQKLSPSKIRGLFEPLGMSEQHHEFQLVFPQFVSVLLKTA